MRTMTRAMAKTAEAAQENSRPEESSNTTLQNEPVESEAVVPASYKTERELESIHGSGDNVHPLGLSPSKLVIEQE